MSKISVYQLKIPEYQISDQLDFERIGKKIDDYLKEYFLGQKIVIRCLGSQNHSGKSVGDLVKIIKKTGTDRYDPDRRGDRYENVENKPIDIFALDFKITRKGKYLASMLESFYSWPKKIGEKPIKIDLVMIYDRAGLKKIFHKYEGRKDVKKDGFIFRDKDNKVGSLRRIIKIL